VSSRFSSDFRRGDPPEDRQASRAVRLLPGHTGADSTVGYLGVEREDADRNADHVRHRPHVAVAGPRRKPGRRGT